MPSQPEDRSFISWKQVTLSGWCHKLGRRSNVIGKLQYLYPFQEAFSVGHYDTLLFV